MKFVFSQDQHDIRDAVAGALEAECPPTRVREAWSGRDTAIRATLAELGVLGLNAAESAGGMGLGALDWVLPAEVTGRFAVPTPLVETLATNPTLSELGEHALGERVASGEAYVALTQAHGLTVDADIAELVLKVTDDGVFASRAPQLEPATCVDGAVRLWRVQGPWEQVSADGTGLRDRARLVAAAQLLGLSRWMLDTAVEYAKARRQFGKPIGAFQAVQHHLVDALLPLRFAMPAVYRAAWCLDAETADRSVVVASAALHAAEAAETVARKALQAHGAIGYTIEHDLHLWMKRSWFLSRTWCDTGALLATVRPTVLGDR